MSIVIARQIAPADFIRFDTFINWSLQLPKTVTKHPVLPSPEIADHVQVGNALFSFRGFIGTPAGAIPSVTAERARLFFDLIGGALCTVTTPFGLFTNVIVTANERERTGGDFRADIRCEQVRIATISEVPIPPRQPSPTAAAQQASSADAGSASAASAGAAGGSVLASAADAASGLAEFFIGG